MSVPAMGLGKKSKEGAHGGFLFQGRVLVFGYSQVRHSNSAFCARNRKRRTRVYLLPCVGLDQVAARLDTCLGDDGTRPIAILKTWGSDLCKVRSEELLRRSR